MKNLRKAVKSELDVEFFACIHSMSMVAVFGFELYLYGIKAIPFGIIFQIFLTGYVTAWFQKILFLKEKIYTKTENIVRSVLWNIGPIIITVIIGGIFDWYKDLPSWISIVFIITMLIYYIMVWWILQVFYKDETNNLNNMLSKYKENYKESEENGNN